jgi:ABC-type hemin transport system ATPase subunit
MPELESPTYALDLRHLSNCVNIAMAKPGEKIRVIVRVEDTATAAKLTEGVGVLSNDGKSFSVVVTREDGARQTCHLRYRDLLKTLSDLS